MRKASAIHFSALGLILLWLATVPVRAQSPQRLTYIRFGGQITPNVPGSQLVQEARSDIYANNYTGAIPLLKEGVRLGNLDAMYFLSRCYIFGYGVPVDTEKARQLLVARARQQQANNRIVSARLQAEKNARIDRAMDATYERARAITNGEIAGSPSTQQSSRTKPKPMLILTPSGPQPRQWYNSWMSPNP